MKNKSKGSTLKLYIAMMLSMFSAAYVMWRMISYFPGNRYFGIVAFALIMAYAVYLLSYFIWISVIVIIEIIKEAKS